MLKRERRGRRAMGRRGRKVPMLWHEAEAWVDRLRHEVQTCTRRVGKQE